MKLTNYYAYLDISNPIACWEVSIGRMVAPELNSPDSVGISLWGYNIIRRMSRNVDKFSHFFIRECQLEQIRRRFFPRKCSRLEGAFFCKNENDVHIALDRWGKSASLHEQVCKINFISDREPTIVDSNYITYCLEGNDIGWMFKYWAGQPYRGQTPLWEVITTGVGHIDRNPRSDMLRQKAYKRMIRTFPDCHVIHRVCQIGFELGFDTVGRATPFLQKTENSSVVNGKLIMDARLFNDDRFLEVLSYHLNARQPNLPPLPNDHSFGKTPDFSQYFFELDLKNMDDRIKKYFNYK